MKFQQNEAALLRAMATAQTLQDQAALAEELQTLRAEHTAQLRTEAGAEWADMVIDATLTPTWRGSQHTAASDWMDEVAPVEAENSHQAMMAEASVWFNRTSPEVRDDREEFSIQAQGMARRLAGQYGSGSAAAAQAFTAYAEFLLHREAASGLDQIEQTTAPDGVTNKPTSLPEDTFDTFAEELAPGNAPGKPSTDNPLLAEIMSTAPFGDSAGPGRPSEHDTSGTQVGHYGPGPVTSSLEDDDVDPFAGLFSRSLALNYTGSLAEWGERLATEAAKCKGEGCTTHAVNDGMCLSCAKKYRTGVDISSDFEKPKKKAARDDDDEGDSRWCDDCGAIKDSKGLCPSCHPNSQRHPDERDLDHHASRVEHVADYLIAEAGSGLDMIDQTIDANNQPKATPLPPEVMFELTPAFSGEESTGAEGGSDTPARHVETPAPQQGAKTSDRKHKTKKEQADERGGYDPSRYGKDDDDDDDDDSSKEASLLTDAVLRYQADYFGNSDEPHKVPGHEREGYDTETHTAPKKATQPATHDLTPSKDQVGGKHKSLHGEGTPATHTTTNPPKKDNLSVGGSADYTKAFKYASAWQPGWNLVQTGSADFEVGLYDGIKANAAAHRRAWVDAHKRQSIQYPYLADRLVAHAQRTSALRRTAGTNTDLNTMAPATYPQPGGNTPLSGEGRPGPLDGQSPPNAPAGAAPYNGSDPKGSGVVPGVNQSVPSRGPNDPRPAQKSLYDGPLNKGRDNTSNNGSSLSGQTLAFRQRVQAALLSETPIEE